MFMMTTLVSGVLMRLSREMSSAVVMDASFSAVLDCETRPTGMGWGTGRKGTQARSF